MAGAAVRALKGHRHLRGELVFCDADGRLLTKEECKHPLWRACKRAGLRLLGWHALRHTFASHLVMRGAAFVRQFRATHMHVRAMVISAYTDEATIEAAKVAGATFMAKPLDFTILGRWVSEASA